MTLPTPQPIREIERLDRARLDAEIRPARQPVVVRGFAQDWPAVQAGRTSPEAAIAYLKRFTRPDPVPALVGPPEIEGRFAYTPDLKALNFQRGQSPIDPFLDRLLRDQATARPYAMAMQSIMLRESLPGFAEANGLDLLDAEVAPRLWIGNRIRVATHYDQKENIGIVIARGRRFTLFPPDQIANLYPGPFELTPAGTPISLVDPANPDLDRFPRFADAMAHAQTALLEPGDLIYIPFHWWHAVDSLDPVSAFVNYWWNPAPAFLGAPYDALMHAFMALRGLPDDQRDVWRVMFDHYVFSPPEAAAAHLPADMQGVLGPLTPEKIGRMKATLIQELSRR